jgi:hypothetical protein
MSSPALMRETRAAVPRRARRPAARRVAAAGPPPAWSGGPLLGAELRDAVVRRCGDGSSCGCAPRALDMVGEVLRSPGDALSGPTRDDMEGRFGADFSGVRVHTGGQAAASARAIDALAYTVGNHIVFGEGQDAGAGRLLAHELTHVLQQGEAGAAGELRIEDPGAPAEQEAAAAAEAVTAGRTPVVRRHTEARVRRSVGSPAGGCGVCFGSAANAGTAAHAVIEEAFRRMYPLVVTEMPLFPAPTDDNGRLDLAMPVLPGLAIGEIKPANPVGMLTGDLDLFWYEQQIALIHVPTTRLRLPPPPPMPFPNAAPPGCPPQTLIVLPPVRGIYMYYCEPDFAELIADPRCGCGERVPVPERVRVPEKRRKREKDPGIRPLWQPEPVPLPAPREVLEQIRRFVREVVKSGEDATEAARRWVAQHPEVVGYVKAAMIGAAIGIVVATIIEDIATLGAGILDDPASFAAAWALVRAAIEIGERAPALVPALP